MSNMRNPFPRGSTEPTQTPGVANRRTTRIEGGRREEQADLDQMAGEGNQNHPTVRGIEANVGDGRVTRYASSAPEDQLSDPRHHEPCESNTTNEVEPYGDAGGPTVHSQGSMPRELPGGPDVDFNS